MFVLVITCTKRTYTKGAYTDCIYTKDIYTKAAFDKNACLENFYAIECSRIQSELFQNFKVRGARLEIRIRPSCTCIKIDCVDENLELEDTGLEIRVGAGGWSWI